MNQQIKGEAMTNYTKEQINDKVFGIISEQLGIDRGEIKPSMSFTEDLETDSLDTVEMVMEFEDVFAIDIEDDQASDFTTVQSVLDFISEKLLS